MLFLVLFLYLYFCVVCKYFPKNPYDNSLFGFSILGVLHFPVEGDLYSQTVGVEMRPRLPTQQYNTINPVWKSLIKMSVKSWEILGMQYFYLIL